MWLVQLYRLYSTEIYLKAMLGKRCGILSEIATAGTAPESMSDNFYAITAVAESVPYDKVFGERVVQTRKSICCTVIPSDSWKYCPICKNSLAETRTEYKCRELRKAGCEYYIGDYRVLHNMDELARGCVGGVGVLVCVAIYVTRDGRQELVYSHDTFNSGLHSLNVAAKTLDNYLTVADIIDPAEKQSLKIHTFLAKKQFLRC